MLKTRVPYVKTCEKCEQSLPVADFIRNGGSRDGYSHKCRKCASICGPTAHIYLWGSKELGVGYVGQDQNRSYPRRFSHSNYVRGRGDGSTRDLSQEIKKKGFTPRYYVLQCLPEASLEQLRQAETNWMRRCTEAGIRLWNKERQDRAKPSATFEMCFDHDRQLVYERLYSLDTTPFTWLPDQIGPEEKALGDRFRQDYLAEIKSAKERKANTTTEEFLQLVKGSK